MSFFDIPLTTQSITPLIMQNLPLRTHIKLPLIRAYSNPIETIKEIVNIPISTFEDAGYTRNKKLIIHHNNKGIITVPYTEDRTYKDIIYINNDKYIMMCVADGHGGTFCSKFIIGRIIFYANIISLESLDANDFLKKLFNFIHIETQKSEYKIPIIKNSGSTLCMALINTTSMILTTANLGDSVCQVIRMNIDSQKRIQVYRTIDQDASNELEQDRIKQINPKAIFDNSSGTCRLNNQLMVVGAFGDWSYDRPLNTIRRNPEINTFQLEKNDIVIVSSDGLYEDIDIKTNKLGPGRNEEEIINDINNFYEQTLETSISKFIHDSHLEQITDKYAMISNILLNENSKKLYLEQISNSIDNNAILIYIV
jgi:serine/threonine protein phosphatase PrpC